MKKKIAKQFRQRKHKIRKRLDKRTRSARVGPMFNPGNIHYGISDRNGGMIYGGIGAMQMMVERHPRGVFGWIKRVDRGVLMHIIGSDE